MNLLAKYFSWILPFCMAASAGLAQGPWLQNAVVKQYDYPAKSDSVVLLEFGYGQYRIQNAAAWERYRNNFIINKVEVVFSAYPVDTAAWNYGGRSSLQTKRVQALLDLDPAFRSSHIAFQNIIQTGCASRGHCRKLFHGFAIYVQPLSPPAADTFKLDTAQAALEIIVDFKLSVIKKIMDGDIPFKDSVILNTFAKHPEWNKMLVVIDLTGSMYPYTAQLLRWIRVHQEKHQLVYLVFFNDGDDYIRHGGLKLDLDPKYNKAIGKTGGIYTASPHSLEEVLDTIHAVMLGGEGGDNPENDVEAILYALKTYQADYQELILIGDNQSAIRDLALAAKITRPVRILLCDESSNRAPHPEKVMLAFKTKGSIHGNNNEVDFADGKTNFIWQGKTYSIGNEKVTQINNHRKE